MEPLLETSRKDVEPRAEVVLLYELKRLANKFTLHQVGALLEAAQPLNIEPDTLLLFWCLVTEALDANDGEIPAKWGLDVAQTNALIERLRYLTPAQCWALVDFIERFWDKYAAVDIELSAELLEELGLTVAKRPAFCHDLGETTI